MLGQSQPPLVMFIGPLDSPPNDSAWAEETRSAPFCDFSTSKIFKLLVSIPGGNRINGTAEPDSCTAHNSVPFSDSPKPFAAID